MIEDQLPYKIVLGADGVATAYYKYQTSRHLVFDTNTYFKDGDDRKTWLLGLGITKVCEGWEGFMLGYKESLKVWYQVDLREKHLTAFGRPPHKIPDLWIIDHFTPEGVTLRPPKVKVIRRMK